MRSPRQYQPLMAGEGERGYGSIQRSLSPKHFFRPEPPPPPPTRKRFYMLFLFFMACFAQGIVWTPLSSLPTEAKLWFSALAKNGSRWAQGPPKPEASHGAFLGDAHATDRESAQAIAQHFLPSELPGLQPSRLF